MLNNWPGAANACAWLLIRILQLEDMSPAATPSSTPTGTLSIASDKGGGGGNVADGDARRATTPRLGVLTCFVSQVELSTAGLVLMGSWHRIGNNFRLGYFCRSLHCVFFLYWRALSSPATLHGCLVRWVRIFVCLFFLFRQTVYTQIFCETSLLSSL